MLDATTTDHPVLVVGTVAFDSIETPFGRAERILGGSATYIGLAARLLTETVGLSAVVGRDFPDARGLTWCRKSILEW